MFLLYFDLRLSRPSKIWSRLIDAVEFPFVPFAEMDTSILQSLAFQGEELACTVSEPHGTATGSDNKVEVFERRRSKRAVACLIVVVESGPCGVDRYLHAIASRRCISTRNSLQHLTASQSRVHSLRKR